VDSHIHLFDLPNNRYMLEDYLADAQGGHNVLAAIYCETQTFARKGGRGRLERCTIERNAEAGVFVEEGGAPLVTECTIRGSGYEAVVIKDAESGGTFEDNDLRENAKGAWFMGAGVGDRLVRRNNKE
jgi:hypothetical protein